MTSTKTGWTIWHKAVAVVVLSSPGILGVTSASAAPAPAVSNSIQAKAVSAQDRVGDVRVGNQRQAPKPSPSGAPASPAAEGRGFVGALVAAIRKIPALVKAIGTAIKKGYTWFTKNVWPAIRAAFDVLSLFVTSWDVWNAFH